MLTPRDRWSSQTEQRIGLLLNILVSIILSQFTVLKAQFCCQKIRSVNSFPTRQTLSPSKKFSTCLKKMQIWREIHGISDGKKAFFFLFSRYYHEALRSVSWEICLNENGIYEWKLAFSIVLTICLKIMKFEHVLVYELLWKVPPWKESTIPFNRTYSCCFWVCNLRQRGQ